MSTMTAPCNRQGTRIGIKSVLRVALATCALLLVPAIAMRFTDEVNWGAEDFIVAALLLGGTGLLLELALKRFTTRTSRIVASLVIIVCLLLVWAELAVGIAGSPFAGS